MANYKRRKHKKVVKDDYVPPFDQSVLQVEIVTLKLKENTQKLLVDAGLKTLYDLVVREDKDFYKIRTFNKKDLFEVKNALRAKNLYNKPSPDAKPEETNKKDTNKKEPDKKAAPNDRKGDKKDRSVQRMPYSDELDAFVEGVEPERPEKPKLTPVVEKQDAYVKVNKGGKWGFKERNGKVVVEPVYDEVFSFHEDLCCVEKEEKFGYINRQGEVVIPLEYDCATSFSEGYACVFKREKCGYINRDNEIVVRFEFDAGTPVVDGECRVKKDGKWGEMHLISSSDGSVKTSDIRWIT